MHKHPLIIFFFALFGIVLFFNGQEPKQTQTGRASFYANAFEGRPTASGEIYYHDKFTAAHPTLPFGTRLKVVNLENGRHVKVRVNDRGPFIKGRIIDLSQAAFKRLAPLEKGILKVRVGQVNRGKR